MSEHTPSAFEPGGYFDQQQRAREARNADKCKYGGRPCGAKVVAGRLLCKYHLDRAAIDAATAKD